MEVQKRFVLEAGKIILLEDRFDTDFVRVALMKDKSGASLPAADQHKIHQSS